MAWLSVSGFLLITAALLAFFLIVANKNDDYERTEDEEECICCGDKSGWCKCGCRFNDDGSSLEEHENFDEGDE